MIAARLRGLFGDEAGGELTQQPFARRIAELMASDRRRAGPVDSIQCSEQRGH